jgi:DNA-binding response OmpR family regulator
VCRTLRSDPGTARLPIIMVTARAQEGDRVLGLESGADDYITKPFSPRELVARVAALLRRVAPPPEGGGPLRHGAVMMDLDRHVVTDGDREVRLTAKEFLLLRYLIRHRGRVLSRDVLLADVWGYQYTGGTRTVDVHVRRLRGLCHSSMGLIIALSLICTVHNCGWFPGGTADARTVHEFHRTGRRTILGRNLCPRAESAGLWSRYEGEV